VAGSQVAIEAAPARSRVRRRLATGATPRWLLALPIGWLIAFFLVPVGLVALYSLGLISLLPGDETGTLEPWRSFFHSSYPGLLWKSVRTALIVSVGCVVIAYPIAYFLAFVAGGRRYILLLLIIVPFWTSFLLRVLAWKVILGSNGVINSLLFSTGLRDEGNPLSQLLYSQFTVMLVLAYVWIPFVVFPIFVSLDAIDTRLLAAAQDLGASRWQAFLRVTLPLSLPGVAAGFAFVFIPTIGEFVTPALVGGTDGFLYGNAIADAFGMNFDLQTGSVLALALLAVVVVATVAFARVLTVRQVTSG
jgi:spermidine/putrescine transport system permease protein